MRAFGADNGKLSGTPGAWINPLAPSLSGEEHAFGVDDGSLYRIPFPVPFPVRVTAAARYQVILDKHRRMRKNSEYWAAYEAWNKIKPIPGGAELSIVNTSVLLYAMDPSDAAKRERARPDRVVLGELLGEDQLADSE